MCIYLFVCFLLVYFVEYGVFACLILFCFTGKDMVPEQKIEIQEAVETRR